MNTSKMDSRIALTIFLISCALGQSVAEEADPPLVEQSISRTCFGCLCEAASGCDTKSGCSGDICGPFAITWGYWADSGKPTLNNEDPNANGAWSRCVNDPFCASKAVQGYMNRFAQDCNGDGVINCDDYIRIHRFGGYGCSGQLPPKYENTYKTCMRTFGL